MDQNKFILLDSCTVEYLLTPELKDLIQKRIDLWFDPTYLRSVSEITCTELIDGAYKDKEHVILTILQTFTNFYVSREVIVAAGQIGSIYKQKNIKQGISLADKIIAATSVLNKCPLITANMNDFPPPFFIHVQTANIKYSHKSKSKILPIGILVPNYDYLLECFDERK